MSKDLKKAAALEALATETTFTAAAEKAGISRRTLYQYLYGDENFAIAYREQLRLKAVARAEQAGKERETALKAIRDIMNDVENPAAVRLKAAERLLDYADGGDQTEMKLAGDAMDVHSGWSFMNT